MIRYSYAGRHNPRYVPWHQNVFVWRSVGSGGSTPALTFDRGGIAPLTKRQRAKLKREAEAQRKRITDGWDETIREQAELRAQIMRGLHPEILGATAPAVVSDDEEEEIEMLLMAA